MLLLVRKGKGVARIDTGLTVVRSDFTRTGKLRNFTVMQQIEEVKLRYIRELNELAAKGESPESAGEIVSRLTRKKEEKEVVDFLKIWRKFMEEESMRGKKNYAAAYRYVCRFVGSEELDISEVTYSFLIRLCKELGPTRRRCSLYLGAMRHVYLCAKERLNDEERGIVRIPYSPFSKFKVPKQRPAVKRALEADVIRAVAALPYDNADRGKGKINRFNLAKDIFILSFSLAGMNSADLFDCREISGRTIHYYRMKTRDRRYDRAEMKITVPEQAWSIAEKYLDKTGKRVFCFWRIYGTKEDFNRALNLGLKDVSAKVEHANIQFYAARHSWATIARNDLRIGKDVINDALNHVDHDMAVTDLYIKKDFSEVNDANVRVVDYVFGKDTE